MRYTLQSLIFAYWDGSVSGLHMGIDQRSLAMFPFGFKNNKSQIFDTNVSLDLFDPRFSHASVLSREGLH